jgi:hypothetical protein
MTLYGCADSPILDYVGGGAEYNPDEAGPRLIRRATGEGATYPNLGTVPKKPTQFSSQAQLTELRSRLSADIASDRAAGQELARIAPAPVPAPANTKLPSLSGQAPPPVTDMTIPSAPPKMPQ